MTNNVNDDIRGYRCPNCSAMIPISRGRVLKCECCGSEFERTSNLQPYYVVTFEGQDILIGRRICGDEMNFFREKDGAECMLKHTLHEMAEDLAEKILPYIAYDVSEDVVGGGLLIRGKVRIGEPTRPLGRAYVNTPAVSDFELRW